MVLWYIVKVVIEHSVYIYIYALFKGQMTHGFKNLSCVCAQFLQCVSGSLQESSAPKLHYVNLLSFVPSYLLWFIVLLSFARGKLVNALCREENTLSLGRQPMLTVARPVALSQTKILCFSREAVTKNSADLVDDW